MHWSGPERLPKALAAARDDAARRLGSRSSGDRLLGPGALLLLLTGRRSASTLRAEGSADWTGDAAATFVARARLPGALRR